MPFQTPFKEETDTWLGCASSQTTMLVFTASVMSELPNHHAGLYRFRQRMATIRFAALSFLIRIVNRDGSNGPIAAI